MISRAKHGVAARKHEIAMECQFTRISSWLQLITSFACKLDLGYFR